MKLNPVVYLLVAIAIASGAIVLVGYFFPSLSGIKGEMLDWAVIFTAVLLLIGVISLVRTHWRKNISGSERPCLQPGSHYFICTHFAGRSSSRADFQMVDVVVQQFNHPN